MLFEILVVGEIRKTGNVMGGHVKLPPISWSFLVKVESNFGYFWAVEGSNGVEKYKESLLSLFFSSYRVSSKMANK